MKRLLTLIAALVLASAGSLAIAGGGTDATAATQKLRADTKEAQEFLKDNAGAKALDAGSVKQAQDLVDRLTKNVQDYRTAAGATTKGEGVARVARGANAAIKRLQDLINKAGGRPTRQETTAPLKKAVADAQDILKKGDAATKAELQAAQRALQSEVQKLRAAGGPESRFIIMRAQKRAQALGAAIKKLGGGQ